MCWIVIYALLPKPMWTYVLGHELTHAIWAWAFGARVKRLAVSRTGGHVVVSKTNTLISLAPYFFPLYAVSLAVLHGILSRWLDPGPLRPWFLLAYGAAYGFHITMTVDVLRTRQPDLVEHGIFFSLVVIWIGNAALVLLSLPFLVEGLAPGDVIRQVNLACTGAYVQVGRFSLAMLRNVGLEVGVPSLFR
jgi:hypothetical protein